MQPRVDSPPFTLIAASRKSVPGTKLNDIDLIPGAGKMFAKSPANHRACSSSSDGIRGETNSARS